MIERGRGPYPILATLNASTNIGSDELARPHTGADMRQVDGCCYTPAHVDRLRSGGAQLSQRRPIGVGTASLVPSSLRIFSQLSRYGKILVSPRTLCVKFPERSAPEATFTIFPSIFP